MVGRIYESEPAVRSGPRAVTADWITSVVTIKIRQKAIVHNSPFLPTL